MNRLQKKIFVAVAGAHLLAVVALLCSGFIRPSPRPDNSQVLDMIPAKLIDQAFSSGARSPAPPPQPLVQPPQPPQPRQTHAEPPQPVPPVKATEPPPPPQINRPEILRPDIPEPKPSKPHTVEVNLKPVVRSKTTETDNNDAAARAAARKEAHLRKERAEAFNSVLQTIKSETSSAATVDMPATSSVAYANYADVVRTVYTEAWTLPDDAASDESNVKVSVTIANDGRVLDAHILEKSGDPSMDASVQRTLDRVTELEPFPDGATEKERTYTINFNLKAKRQLE